MKRLLVICLLLTLSACSTLQESWKENMAASPDGGKTDADMKFQVGGSEKTSSEEKTDLYNSSKSDSLINDLSIGVSNSWKF